TSSPLLPRGRRRRPEWFPRSGAYAPSAARKFSRLIRVIIHWKLQCQPWGKRMSTITSNAGAVPAGEPKPIIPPLASFYLHARDLGWLVVRLTAGGMLLVHGIMKIMPMSEKGFAATIEAFAIGSMARRGIEPAIAAAYAVFFLETVGAILIILGLFTRFFAAAL